MKKTTLALIHQATVALGSLGFDNGRSNAGLNWACVKATKDLVRHHSQGLLDQLQQSLNFSKF